MPCNTCPFADTAEAEQAQNYGCLPTRQEILRMHRDQGRNWACHGDESRVCAGLVRALAEIGVVFDKTAPMISYNLWYQDGVG